MVGVAVEHLELDVGVVADHGHDLFHPREVPVTEHAIAEHLVTNTGCAWSRNALCLPGSGPFLSVRNRTVLVCSYRYAYRLNPTPSQCQALARALGCARVVFNDAVAARRAARESGAPFPTDAALSKALTAAKRTPERAWLGEVSAVVLQQALADANTAYRNFFTSCKGTRKGRKLGAPRFRTRRDRAQSIRFTKAARFRVTPAGRLRLPGIGDVPVRWSRDLPSDPSSVTVTVDAAGR